MKKYYALYEKIKNLILSGEYKAGQKLPSKRVMADMSGCSQITVMNAYGILEAEGYITAVEKRGYFVDDINAHYYAPTKPTLIERLSEQECNVKDDFEHSLWFKTVRKVITERGNQLFVKCNAEGCSALRNSIADYLLRYRGMVASPDRIIIGSGSEQLYETVVKILGRDKIFGIEDPSYKQIEKVYNEEGVTVKKLKMGGDGIKSDYLNASDFNVLHVTPFTSYPSGVTASIKKRYEYLSWANRTGGYIVEDDFSSEFFKPGNPIQSLYSLSDNERVIYINTFSKSISPSIRIGYMILPTSLISIYKERVGGFSCSVPVLDQYVLAEFISSGSFERHLNRVRRKMNKELKN